jgi:hypothetical protein
MNRGMELSEVQEGIREAETAAKVRKKSRNSFFSSNLLFCIA